VERVTGRPFERLHRGAHLPPARDHADAVAHDYIPGWVPGLAQSAAPRPERLGHVDHAERSYVITGRTRGSRTTGRRRVAL
jgi:hypothetical protein